MKTGIVCEGGGTKIAYTAGVLAALIEHNVNVDYIVGISAGAEVAVPYVSRQPEREYVIGVDTSAKPGLIGLKSLLREGSIFGIQDASRYVEEKAPLDFETFFSNPTECEVGVYDIKGHKTEYFGKEYIDESNDLIIASCSLFLLSKPYKWNGKKYIDAGLVDMIPIEQALKSGCDRVIVISTKEMGYRRKPANKFQLFGAWVLYHNKELTANLRNRHINYNKQWDLIDRLEEEGKAMVLRPHKDFGLTRYTTDRGKLDKWFNLGKEETIDRLPAIEAFLGGKERSFVEQLEQAACYKEKVPC